MSFNISEVVKNELCTGCATCISLCPIGALTLHLDDENGIFIPKIDLNLCNNCGICFKVCPGHEVNFEELNLEIFGKLPESDLIGNYLKCYTGHSNFNNIRFEASAGGLITQILINSLERGVIDGALVTRMNKNNPLKPEPFIARTREEIIEASKSKYCPVPANISLKEIMESNDGEKFAVVGLPCHIHGIRKAEDLIPELNEKIVLHLGIFCSMNRNFFSQEYILSEFGINKGDILKFDYRGKGWMGYMSIKLKDGTEKLLYYRDWWNKMLRLYFIPLRCTLCSDQACELADASFGDIWIPEFRNDKIGTSVVISRNKNFQDLLDNFSNDIVVKIIGLKKVIESQKHPLVTKKYYIKAHFDILSFFGKKVPVYNQKMNNASFIAYLNSIILYFSLFISSKKKSWSFLRPFGHLLDFVSKIKGK